MKKGAFCILLALLVLLFIIVCAKQLTNEPRESVVGETVSDYNTGFPGEELDVSDTNTELEKKTSVSDIKQIQDDSAKTPDMDDALADRSESDVVDGTSVDKDASSDVDDTSATLDETVGDGADAPEVAPEESKTPSATNENTYDGDLLEPLKTGSYGVI